MFKYTSSGLDNIWLSNGFTEKETLYGKAISIHDLAGLHKAIGLHLVNNVAELESSHFKFLRKELDITQDQLADILGVNESTVRNWENGRTQITVAAALVLRKLYAEYVDEAGAIRELIDRISKLNRELKDYQLCLTETDEGWRAAA